MQYYDPDDILLGESRIPVVFAHRIQNFGFLGPRTCKAVPRGRRVDVPYFLVAFLMRNGHCELAEGFPDAGVLDDIRARASAVDLRSRSHYFFFLYSMLLGAKEPLQEFFYERVADYSCLVLKSVFSEDDVWQLDMTERALVTRSRRRFQEFHGFLVGRH